MLFSLVVTIVMNGLDMMYHLNSGVAVHLNYVAVKIAVILLTVWMITEYVGKGTQEGIVASLIGPFMFYLYYVFAGPTLNRQEFTLDEQFWFIFLHVLCMLIAYFSAWHFVRGDSRAARLLGFGVSVWWTATALFALYQMLTLKFVGTGYEDQARFMTLSVMVGPALTFLISAVGSILLVMFLDTRAIHRVALSLVCALVLAVWHQSVASGIAAFSVILLSHYMLHSYRKGFLEVQA
jgi:hypothetical protein